MKIKNGIKNLAAHQITGANVTTPASYAFGVKQARADAQLRR
jgi:hypothetical protein